MLHSAIAAAGNARRFFDGSIPSIIQFRDKFRRDVVFDPAFL
jgi:hypothetical protein